jgi:hypothetical protein
MLREALNQAADSWLTLTGDSATYRNTVTGIRSTVIATLEQDVSTVDEYGMVTAGHVVSLSPRDISLPARGDTIKFDAGTYRVDELLDSPGYLTRVFVSKVI